ncbi:MAG TPA: hypothetical protein VK788_05595 [Terriglobales bacterium]|nr:hypothetical protein [Terriglobales bacterium]
MTKAADYMKSYSGSPACASENNVATLKTRLKRVALLAFGWVLALGGIIGLFLPIVPGSFLIVAGALMLSPQMRVAAASTGEVFCTISQSWSFGSVAVCSITMAEVRR